MEIVPMFTSDDEPAQPAPSAAANRSIEEQLAAILTWRESLGPQVFDPEEIDAFKREGRR
jgi:hypothetical protein